MVFLVLKKDILNAVYIEIARNRGFLVVIEQAGTSLLLSVTTEGKIN